MHWLRRIPPETRIVVFVVFFALLQAILLSVFGLGAIRGERRQAERQIRLYAGNFLRINVAQRCQGELRDRADEVFEAAFDTRQPAWKDADDERAVGVFTGAFHVRPDGSILSPEGLPLWLPRDAAAAAAEQARVAAERHQAQFARSLFDEAERRRRDLLLARAYPFAQDELGESLAFLYACAPMMSGDAAPDVATLLRIRWIGVLNRFAGYAEAAATGRFLARVEAAGGNDQGFRHGCEVQDRRERALQALRREQAGFPRGSPPMLHRNVFAGPETLFYVRQFGSDGDRRVLAVDGARFVEFLDSVQEAARRDAMQGVVPSIRPAAEAPGGDAPRVPIAGLPGWTARASISDRAVRDRAAKSERIYWYIIGFSIAGIIAGGLFTARVVMREVRLAKLKSGFVSNVSHGLKTPLTSIRMFSEMLRSGQVKDEEERRECLDVILQETTRLGQLIQQVLDFGRLEARQRAFAWITGSLAPLVQREADRFRRTTGLGDRFEAHLAVNLPPVTFDPDAMREVVSNLLSNAYKYSPPADRRVELTLGPQGGRVVLAVEDNGPGIPPRERRRIFDQFYRANDLLTREVEGTGLGLSIVRNIVRAHGGRIEVGDSELGGSRFAVNLPSASRKAQAGRPTPAETTR